MQHALFPSIVHQLQVENFQRDNLIQFVEDEIRKDPQGLERTNRGGWHSGQRLDLDDNVLKTFVEREVINYIVQNGPNPLNFLVHGWSISNYISYPPNLYILKSIHFFLLPLYVFMQDTQNYFRIILC